MRNTLNHVSSNQKRAKSIFRYLTYLIILTSIITEVTVSRYTRNSSGGDESPIAKFSYTCIISDPNTQNLGTLNPSIYATCKLSEADECDFDKAVVIKTIEVINHSEVAVRASLSIISEMSETKGIVWCIFNNLPQAVSGQNKIAKAIATKLGGSVPSILTELQTEQKKVNDETLSAWNAEANLDHYGSENKKSIIIVFWAEHDLFALSRKNPPDLATATLEFKFRISVSQAY